MAARRRPSGRGAIPAPDPGPQKAVLVPRGGAIRSVATNGSRPAAPASPLGAIPGGIMGVTASAGVIGGPAAHLSVGPRGRDGPDRHSAMPRGPRFAPHGRD